MEDFHPKALLQCKVCIQLFNDQESLDSHIQLVHMLDICSCEFCGEEFKNRNDWQDHVLVDHGCDPSEVSQLGGKYQD